MFTLIVSLFFALSLQAQTIATFPDSFLFGVANAPGHVEDKLDDTWIRFSNKDKIRAFHNQASPELRLEFWSKPEIELDLAKQLGVTVFRLGVDWGRIHTGPQSFDQVAIERYRKILQMVKDRKMKVMLTLFHFTVPKWVEDQGGWKNEDTKNHFVEFSQKMIQEFHPQVDFWITFNEPQIFATMAYTAGVFPPGEKSSFLSMLDLVFYQGETIQSLHLMSQSHHQIYDWAKKQFPQIQIGISQHMGFHNGKNFFSRMLSKYTGEFMNWFFPDLIKGKMDFFGFNYYGAEWIKLTGVDIDPDEEYSEAGRAVYPQGLYLIMKQIHERYPTLPQFITENGISDATDWLRPSYLIEHLLAINAAQKENIKVLGYIFWTLTDNMEWSDGYCPKFGLVRVNRKYQMQREIRPSFYLYQRIIKEKKISSLERESSWEIIQNFKGKERPFCRAHDGVTGLDEPIFRKLSPKDWRFSI
jgi:beta-glucosidase/6-phospho-beta-glucosidase/beta-galactosidase